MPTPLLLLLTAAAYGASTVLIGAALAHFPPLTLAALRAVLALPLLLVLAGASGRQKRPDRHDLITMLVGGTLVVTVPFVALAAGLQFIPSGMGGMLLAAMPLFTLALAPLFQRDEPAHFDQGLRIGAGFFGVALMAIPGLLGQGFAQVGQGTLLTLLAPLSYAAGNIWFRRRRRVAPLMLSVAVFLVGAVTLWPLALLIDGPVAIRDPATALPLLLALVLGGTLAPLVLNFVMLERGAVRQAGLAFLLMPLFSLAFGGYFLGESLSLLGLTGLALVIAGATWRVAEGRRARAALPAEVQGLMRRAPGRASPGAGHPVLTPAEGSVPRPAAVKPTPEERAARRAGRRAGRQKAQETGVPAVEPASPKAGPRPVPAAATAAPAPGPDASEAPADTANKGRTGPKTRRQAERQAARKVARRATKGAEAQARPAGAPEPAPGIEPSAAQAAPRPAPAAFPAAVSLAGDGAAPGPDAAEAPAGAFGGENSGPKTARQAERQAARKAARRAARQAGKAALQDN